MIKYCFRLLMVFYGSHINTKMAFRIRIDQLYKDELLDVIITNGGLLNRDNVSVGKHLPKVEV